MLKVNSLSTSHVIGMPEADSEGLLEQVFAVLYDPANVYEHHWLVGDLVIFDNVGVHHARADFDSGERRTLRRVVLDEHPPMKVTPELAALYEQAQHLAGHGGRS